MKETGPSIPLVPLQSSAGVSRPSIEAEGLSDELDERYSSRTSEKQPLVANDKEMSTGIATRTLDSPVRTPETLATRHRSLFGWRIPEGWRFGATLGATLSLVALIANLAMVIVATAQVRRENGQLSTIASIRNGNCEEIEHIGLGIHLVINVVSTLLLGASNYCMQCLSAPTREDIDRAHQKGSWLHVGVISPRNLISTKRIKLVFWLLLGSSSLPLHLLYNSTFFVSLTNNSYNIYYTSDAFSTGAPYDDGFSPGIVNYTLWRSDGMEINESIRVNYFLDPSTVQSAAEGLGTPLNGFYFERLDNSACIEAYAKPILSDRRTLILVASNSPQNNEYLDQYTDACTNSSQGLSGMGQLDLVTCDENSSIYAVDTYGGFVIPESMPLKSVWFAWICSQRTAYADSSLPEESLCSDGYWQTIQSNASQWSVWGFDIEYCISEVVENQCSLNVAINLLAVVTIFNAVKFVVMAIVVWKIRDRPLITVGDAAASFVRQPDATTQRMCLLTKEDVISRSPRLRGLRYGLLEPQPYKVEKRKQASAASKARWIISTVLTSAAIGTILGLLGFAIKTLKTRYGHGNLQSLWNLGLGTTSPYTLIQGWNVPQSGNSAIVATVLIANLPQALFSIIYVIINSLFTSLSIASEWSRYAHQRRALRVSYPTGKQRSTYFLQVPYRLGIPLMCFSTFLHWIISQSIFIVKVNGVSRYINPQDDDSDNINAVTCGYSPLGMLITTLATFTLILFAGLLGARSLKPGIPLVGSCSAAIAAACHAPKGTSECEPVMWGAIPGAEEAMDNGATVGHCAFSNERVKLPTIGQLYA